MKDLAFEIMYKYSDLCHLANNTQFEVIGGSEELELFQIEKDVFKLFDLETHNRYSDIKIRTFSDVVNVCELECLELHSK